MAATDPERAFADDRLDLIADIETWHFWFAGRRRLVTRLLQQSTTPSAGRVLDVGCGTGDMMRHLSGLGYRMVGVDPLAGAIPGDGRGRVSSARADARDLPIAPASFAAVLMLDVLEHTDDVRALREAYRALAPGGCLVLTVPAYPSLWSARDEAAGHLRRYTRRALFDVIARTAFRVERWTAYQCLLLPAMALSRRRARGHAGALDSEDRPGPVMNRLLGLINGIELAAGRLVRWPVGSTFVVQARKDDARAPIGGLHI